MKWSQIKSQPCSIARSLSEIGERWTLLIIREAFQGASKFADFLEGSGAARNIVATRLELLVEANILFKEAYQKNPTRYEYRLTQKGLELYPVLMTLVRWGDRWHSSPKGRPVEHVHRTCGHVFQVEIHCSECHEKVQVQDTFVRPGPGYTDVDTSS